MNTLEEQLEIVQAALDKKAIQRIGTKGGWITHNATKGMFNFVSHVYRVKPEPRVIYINEYDNKDQYIHTTLESAQLCAQDCKTIKFIEVVE